VLIIIISVLLLAMPFALAGIEEDEKSRSVRRQSSKGPLLRVSGQSI